MNLRATYRLQFTADFTFADAGEIAPYLARLGISHVYASPIFEARPGSTHGYDVTDPNRLNPELGTEADFRAMIAAVRDAGLGLILDIVPNHMGIGGASNRFWLDVLEWGEASRFASWFDIDWNSDRPGLAGKVLVPFLGAHYGEALAAGALELRFDRVEGAFAIWAHGTHKLPVCPRTYGPILRAGGLDAEADAIEGDAPPEAPHWADLKSRLADRSGIEQALAAFRGREGDLASWASLDALVALQHWRPAKFNLDGDAINYRRFFTISDLAGVRVERQEVFDATHRLALRLLREGAIDGLRIDHIDGLLDPKAYTLRLREAAGRPFHLLVEKIVAPDEELPETWQADGTTGYEVANLLIGLLVDPDATETLSRAYADFTGRDQPPGEIVRQAKDAIMARPMAAETEAIISRLLGIAARDPMRCDLGRADLRAAVRAYVTALDVYRTYGDGNGLASEDRSRADRALGEARRLAPWVDPEAFGLLAEVVGLSAPGAEREGIVLETAMRLQQLSGPVMAKGLEDTALYRYNRLIALNEVGSEPGRFVTSLETFHRANIRRLERSPGAMLTTSTHDTKRGEDARARIAAISGHAEAWLRNVRAWHDLLADPSQPIDRNEEYFLYQLLLGSWPTEWPPTEEPPLDALSELAARVTTAMLKSVREAGVNTRWVFGDSGYEAALAAFIERALAPGGAFLTAFRTFERTIAADGAANGLIQTALKLTIPGVPDIYQGAEVWEQSMVDPDNRRPVDFAARAALLDGLRGDAIPSGPAGKIALTSRLLALRKASPDLFDKGSYEPLTATGPEAESVCGFLRRHASETLFVAAALHPGRRRANRWEATQLGVPDLPPGGLLDILEGRTFSDLTPAALFRKRPLAILHRPAPGP